MSSTATYVLQTSLGLVFLLSGIGKLRSASEYFDQLREYRVVPASLVLPVGVLIVTAELALAVAHLLGWQLYIATRVSLLMLLAFVSVVSVLLHRKRDAPCLCFGAKSGERVSRRTLGRLCLLMAGEGWLCISLDAASVAPASLDVREIVLCVAFASLALITIAWLFRLPELVPMAKRAFTRSTSHRRVPQP